MYRQSVRLYIPDPDGEGKPWVDEALSQFSAMFGGATFYRGTGSWSSDTGKLLVEPIGIVEAHETKPGLFGTYGPSIRNLASKIKAEMRQETVLYVFSLVEPVLV